MIKKTQIFLSVLAFISAILVTTSSFAEGGGSSGGSRRDSEAVRCVREAQRVSIKINADLTIVLFKKCRDLISDPRCVASYAEVLSAEDAVSRCNN